MTNQIYDWDKNRRKKLISNSWYKLEHYWKPEIIGWLFHPHMGLFNNVRPWFRMWDSNSGPERNGRPMIPDFHWWSSLHYIINLTIRITTISTNPIICSLVASFKMNTRSSSEKVWPLESNPYPIEIAIYFRQWMNGCIYYNLHKCFVSIQCFLL